MSENLSKTSFPRALGEWPAAETPRRPHPLLSTTVIQMQKLALKLDDLSVQSFETMPAARGVRGTVLANQESHDEAACTDACTLSPSCASCAESCDGCDSWQGCWPDDTADPGRRIILY